MRKQANWVRSSGAVPATESWDEWLHQAHREAQADNAAWDVREALAQILLSSRTREEFSDVAEQSIPMRVET